MVKRQESLHKSKTLELAKTVLPKFMIMPHEDVRSNGYPDWSVAAYGRDSWWEWKHGTPHFDSYGYQELTMKRLSTASYHARYIILLEDEDGSNRRSLIVHPDKFSTLEPEAETVGFNYHWILEQIRKVHQS